MKVEKDQAVKNTKCDSDRFLMFLHTDIMYLDRHPMLDNIL